MGKISCLRVTSFPVPEFLAQFWLIQYSFARQKGRKFDLGWVLNKSFIYFIDLFVFQGPISIVSVLISIFMAMLVASNSQNREINLKVL